MSVLDDMLAARALLLQRPAFERTEFYCHDSAQIGTLLTWDSKIDFGTRTFVFHPDDYEEIRTSLERFPEEQSKVDAAYARYKLPIPPMQEEETEAHEEV